MNPTQEAKALAQKVMASLEYDIGLNVLCFVYGMMVSEVKKMNPEIVRAFGRNGFPKQTHCPECGQILPDDL